MISLRPLNRPQAAFSDRAHWIDGPGHAVHIPPVIERAVRMNQSNQTARSF